MCDLCEQNRAIRECFLCSLQFCRRCILWQDKIAWCPECTAILREIDKKAK